MKILILVLPLLAACADPVTVFKPVRVDVPIETPCRSETVVKPDFALAHIRTSDSLFVKTRAALIEIDQRQAYEAALQTASSLCQ